MNLTRLRIKALKILAGAPSWTSEVMKAQARMTNTQTTRQQNNGHRPQGLARWAGSYAAPEIKAGLVNETNKGRAGEYSGRMLYITSKGRKALEEC